MATFKPVGDFMDYTFESWGNGSRIEFILHSNPLPGEDPSDQLEMRVVDQDGKAQGWLLNVEDAMVMVRGLSRLVDCAISIQKPISPNYTGPLTSVDKLLAEAVLEKAKR